MGNAQAVNMPVPSQISSPVPSQVSSQVSSPVSSPAPQTTSQIIQPVPTTVPIGNISYNKALHIGINYEGTSHELRGCINDTITISELTKKDVLDIRRLFLTDHTKYKPDIKNIQQAFKWLRCRKCDNSGLWSCPHNYNHQPDTTLYFSYSGHGSQVKDTDGDEIDGRDETLYALDGHITDDYMFSNLIYPIPSGVRLWCILDCCHSSTSLDLQFSIEDINGNRFTLVDNNDKTCKGDVVMVSGCLDHQTSADAYINNSFQGAMTAALKHILAKYPNIKMMELFKELRIYMENNNYTQRPAISFGGNLNLANTFLSTS